MSGWTRQHPIRSKARRAKCPRCGRDIAAAYDWEGGYWRLRPHNREVGQPCTGYQAVTGTVA